MIGDKTESVRVVVVGYASIYELSIRGVLVSTRLIVLHIITHISSHYTHRKLSSYKNQFLFHLDNFLYSSSDVTDQLSGVRREVRRAVLRAARLSRASLRASRAALLVLLASDD